MPQLVKRIVTIVVVVVLLLLVVATAVPVWMAWDAMHITMDERPPIVETPADYGLEYEDVELTTDDGLKLAAWYVPSQNGAAIIAQHGYISDRHVMLNIASILAKHGYGVIMTDLRSHGESEGELVTFGYLEVNDVKAAYEYLLTRPDVNPDKIGAIGNSLGGAILIMYAAENEQIKAVVAHSAFATFDSTVDYNVKRFTGLPPFPFADITKLTTQLGGGYSVSEINITEYIDDISPRPILLMQGGADEDIPPDSGQRLYEAAKEPKELWYEPDQEHVFFDRDYPEEFERRVVGLFDEYVLEETGN